MQLLPSKRFLFTRPARVLIIISILMLMALVLPVKSSDEDKTVVHQPVITIDVSNNIAVMEGKVASEEQARTAERLILSISGIDLVENKLTIDATLPDDISVKAPIVRKLSLSATPG